MDDDLTTLLLFAAGAYVVINVVRFGKACSNIGMVPPLYCMLVSAPLFSLMGNVPL